MYQTIFPDETTDPMRAKAEVACIDNNHRLEKDDLVYNAYGIAVARYRGHDSRGLIFENLVLETDFDKAKILRRG